MEYSKSVRVFGRNRQEMIIFWNYDSERETTRKILEQETLKIV